MVKAIKYCPGYASCRFVDGISALGVLIGENRRRRCVSFLLLTLNGTFGRSFECKLEGGNLVPVRVLPASDCHSAVVLDILPAAEAAVCGNPSPE